MMAEENNNKQNDMDEMKEQILEMAMRQHLRIMQSFEDYENDKIPKRKSKYSSFYDRTCWW